MRAALLLLPVVLASVTTILVPRSARAEAPPTRGMAAAETSEGMLVSSRLARGETLRYPQEAEYAGGHYVGGVSYTLVDGTASAITALCEDERAWRTFLPHVTAVRIVERRSDEDLYVEISQGNALLDATYTLHVRLDVQLGEARFWMVRGRPHDIADAWGYFRFTPVDVVTRGANGAATPGRTLVTVGVLVDVGSGWMRSLVEPKVQNAVLGVSDRVRDYVRYALR